MKSIIFFSILGVFYILFLVYLFRKAKDVFSHPERYDEIKGWTRYSKSFWYERDEDYFRLSSRNYWAFIVTLPVPISILAAYYFLAVFLQRQLFSPVDAIMVFRPELFYLGFFATLLYAVVLDFWIAFHSKVPLFIASSKEAFSSKNRSRDWKKLIVTMVVATVICFPFLALSVDNYGYMTETKLAYNEFFGATEADYSFAAMTGASTSYTANEKQTKFNFHYIILMEDGRTLDLFRFSPAAVLKINELMVQKGVPLEKGVMTQAVYETIQHGQQKDFEKVVTACFVIK